MMNPTTTAYGTWSGGRFMHFGEALDDNRLVDLVRIAYEEGIRTFVTADTYGSGKADEMLGRALQPFERESYSLVGAVGHDIYDGVRAGAPRACARGYPPRSPAPPGGPPMKMKSDARRQICHLSVTVVT